MNNWDYANQIPTDPWRSAQSIPRSIHLKTVDEKIRMIQKPVVELQSLRDQYVQLNNVSTNLETISLSDQGISGKAYEMIIDLDPEDAEIAGLKIRSGINEATIIGYDAGRGTVFVDRTNSGDDSFHENFATRNDAPVSLNEGKLRLHIFVDWSSVEVFANDGEVVMTNRIFPDPQSQDVLIFSEGGNAVFESIEYWSLKSIWN